MFLFWWEGGGDIGYALLCVYSWDQAYMHIVTRLKEVSFFQGCAFRDPLYCIIQSHLAS